CLCHLSRSFIIDTPPTEIYTLSLHDALPIWLGHGAQHSGHGRSAATAAGRDPALTRGRRARRQRLLPQRPGAGIRQIRVQAELRSEEHTSELQSRENLVCRLLLEKKKQQPRQ